MWTLKELESMINKHAKTSVAMRGEIDANGKYAGHLEGSTTDELYAFVAFIAKERGTAFDQVAFRYGKQNPPTFTCYIDFDTNAIKTKKGFLGLFK